MSRLTLSIGAPQNPAFDMPFAISVAKDLTYVLDADTEPSPDATRRISGGAGVGPRFPNPPTRKATRRSKSLNWNRNDKSYAGKIGGVFSLDRTAKRQPLIFSLMDEDQLPILIPCATNWE